MYMPTKASEREGWISRKEQEEFIVYAFWEGVRGQDTKHSGQKWEVEKQVREGFVLMWTNV